MLFRSYQRKMSETGCQDLGWSSKPEKTVKGAGSHLGFRLAYDSLSGENSTSMEDSIIWGKGLYKINGGVAC